MHGGPRNRDEAGYFFTIQAPSPVTGLQTCWTEVFFSIRVDTPCLILLPLPRPLCSYEDVWGDLWRGLSAGCDTTVWCLWGHLKVAGGGSKWQKHKTPKPTALGKALEHVVWAETISTISFWIFCDSSAPLWSPKSFVSQSALRVVKPVGSPKNFKF